MRMTERFEVAPRKEQDHIALRFDLMVDIACGADVACLLTIRTERLLSQHERS
jgi:hypothetical protein